MRCISCSLFWEGGSWAAGKAAYLTPHLLLAGADPIQVALGVSRQTRRERHVTPPSASVANVKCVCILYQESTKNASQNPSYSNTY